MQGSETSDITFVCFMPMCFFFAGTAIFNMQQEVRALKKQVAELKGKQA
jgi:hypothetical protein